VESVYLLCCWSPTLPLRNATFVLFGYEGKSGSVDASSCRIKSIKISGVQVLFSFIGWMGRLTMRSSYILRIMVGKNNNRKVRGRRKSANGTVPSVCPPGSSVYRGAVVPRALNSSSVAVEDRVFTQVSVVSANGAGTISLGVTTNPNSTTEWTSYSARYVEYRTLAFRVRFIPNLEYFSNTTGLANVYGTLYGGIIRDVGYSLPASAAAAFALSMKANTIQRPMTIDWRMSGQPDGLWSNVRTPGASSTVFMTAFGLTASATYGAAHIQYLVQFRNRI